MGAVRLHSSRLPMLLGAAALGVTMFALYVASPPKQSSELIGGMDFAGGIPPEGVLDDMMGNVDPTDPYGGPVWGLHSGDIGMGEYGAKPQQLWSFGQGYQHQEMQPLTVGAGDAGPPPSYEATLPEQKARATQLWGWNMGYEHHEQPPIYFGPSARRNAAEQQAQLKQQAAREMQLWGWNMGYEHHEQPSFHTFPAKSDDAQGKTTQLAAAQGKGRQQKLWGWNQSYEHHEQPPIYFGTGARNGAAEAMEAGLKQQAARQMQLWMWNMGYDHHEPQPPSMWPARAPAPKVV